MLLTTITRMQRNLRRCLITHLKKQISKNLLLMAVTCLCRQRRGRLTMNNMIKQVLFHTGGDVATFIYVPCAKRTYVKRLETLALQVDALALLAWCLVPSLFQHLSPASPPNRRLPCSSLSLGVPESVEQIVSSVFQLANKRASDGLLPQ